MPTSPRASGGSWYSLLHHHLGACNSTSGMQCSKDWRRQYSHAGMGYRGARSRSPSLCAGRRFARILRADCPYSNTAPWHPWCTPLNTREGKGRAQSAPQDDPLSRLRRGTAPSHARPVDLLQPQRNEASSTAESSVPWRLRPRPQARRQHQPDRAIAAPTPLLCIARAAQSTSPR